MNTPSEAVLADMGTSMNSCISTLFPAWAPPFITFMKGLGSLPLLAPPRYSYSSRPLPRAAAFAQAMDAASIAFAPSRERFDVPSNSHMALSMACCSAASMPVSREHMGPEILAAASCTPRPLRRGPPSRSSWASCAPVDAPEGTPARAIMPLVSSTRASTAGQPREFSISRAVIDFIRIKTHPFAAIMPAKGIDYSADFV